jgi:hypothetical protein
VSQCQKWCASNKGGRAQENDAIGVEHRVVWGIALGGANFTANGTSA